MKFNDYLLEKSYVPSDLPKDFWVVFDLEEMLDELKTGKVKGLKGISSNSNIQFDFLGVARDAMLQMDSEELLKQNKITRIMYDNPHFLVSKNMWGLKRLYNARSAQWISQVFGNIFERIQAEMKPVDKQLAYDMEYYGFRNVDYDWAKKMSPRLKINNIKDLSKIIKTYIETIFSEKTGISYNIPLQKMQDIIYKSLETIGKIYSGENEWVIKNDVLTIPKKSHLYILTKEPDIVNQKAYDVVKDNLKTNSMDMFFIFKENDIDDKYYKDVSLYKSLIKTDMWAEQLGNKYKIIRYDLDDFKRKQNEFWKKGQQ